MRLTLRTLLAYRDGVLDAVHVSELKRKFEESTTARSISQRIESGIRNRKLLTLPIDAKGFGVDPNDVATFLDGTMPLDRLPDMERQCLESNSLLAEVAASHQILSRALRANTSVSQELLDRLLRVGNTTSVSPLAQTPHGSKTGYGSEALRMEKESARTAEPFIEAPDSRVSIIRRADSNHTPLNAPNLHRLNVPNDHVAHEASAAPARISDSDAEFGSPADHALSGSLRRNSGVIDDFVNTGIELDNQLGSQIPEYLLGGDKKGFSDLLTIAILLTLFIFSVWMAMGPLDQIRGLLVAQTRTLPPQTHEPFHTPASGTPSDSPQVKERELDAAKIVEPTAPLDSPETVLDSPEDPAEGSTDRLPVDRAPQSDRPNDQVISPTRTSDSNLSSALGTTEPVGTAGSFATTTWTWPAASNPETIRFLFVKGKNQPDWSMKANSEKVVIPSSDQITIVAPSYCELTTSSTDQRSDFRWIISGDTKVEYVDTSEQSPRFRLATRFAKILPSEKSRSLELELDSGILVLHFLSSQSEACIQTRSQLPHTAIAVPDALIGLGEARIAAVGGELVVDWKPRNLLPPSSMDPTSTEKANVGLSDVVLSPFHEAVIASPKEGEATFFTLQTQRSEFPWWLGDELDFGNHPRLTPMQQAMLASPSDWKDTLDRFAKSDDIEAALEGLYTQIQLGKYELLFGSDGIFRRTELQSELGNLLDHLLTQLRSAEEVAEFQTQLKAHVGERDVAVMELLIPKTNRELESGSDKQLVDYLSDSMIDIRALAIMQLEMLTGVTHGYQATNPSAESLQAWKRSLAKKQIRSRESSGPEQPELNQ